MARKDEDHALKLNNKRLNGLLNRYEKATKEHGWEEDQGTSDTAAKAKASFLRARDRFINALNLALGARDVEVTGENKRRNR